MSFGEAETVHCRIEGRVQGVWYRGWTCKMAEKFGLTGWVRNRADGSVEAMFQGQAQNILDMIEACKKGPMAARVDRVSTEYVKNADTLSGFKQRPTY